MVKNREEQTMWKVIKVAWKSATAVIVAIITTVGASYIPILPDRVSTMFSHTSVSDTTALKLMEGKLDKLIERSERSAETDSLLRVIDSLCDATKYAELKDDIQRIDEQLEAGNQSLDKILAGLDNLADDTNKDMAQTKQDLVREIRNLRTIDDNLKLRIINQLIHGK